MKNVVGADAPRNLSATADGVVVDTLLKGDAAGHAVGLAEIVFAVFERESHFSVFNDVTEDDITLPNFDESKLRSRMPDMRLDLIWDAECYAVASDELPLERANLIARKGDMVFGVYILEETVTYSDVPEEFAQNIPVGDGWDYQEQEGELHFLSELTEARVSAAETSEETSEPEQTEIPKMNNAELLGEDHPEMQELLQRPAVFMTGDLYGQKDRRNTLDGDWKRVKLPWLAWLSGEDKGKQSWGLTRHPEHKSKEGPSIVLADAIDGARKDAAIKTMYAVGLDIDSGAALDAVVKKLQEKGLFAIVYSSFRHKTTDLVLKHDDIIRKLKLDESPNRAQIQIYMREHHKDRYDEDFIQSIEIIDLRKQTPDGLRTVLKTRPLDKFRVILPLWEPVELANLGATVNQWKDVWADAVTGVAVNMLGVSFDATSTDVNRLFFTPRHKAGSEYYSAVIQGRPLRFEDIEPYSKARYVKERDPGDPFATAGGDVDTGKRERFSTENNFDLNKWHRGHKERWMAADVIESYCQDKIRIAGNEKAGTVHLECPFEHEHSTEGGTATMAMNPDENEAGYWTVFCRHDACQGRDKLEFIKEMVDEGWFPEEVLTDEQWNTPLPDEDVTSEPVNLGTNAISKLVEEEGLDKDSSKAEINAFVEKLVKTGVDESVENRVCGILGTNSRNKDGKTVFTPSDIKKMFGNVRREIEQKRRERDEEEGGDKDTIPVTNQWDFGDMVGWGENRIQEANAKKPRLFHYIDEVARIEETAEAVPRIRMLTEKQFAAELNGFTKWCHVSTMGDVTRHREVAAPKEVVSQLYSSAHTVYPKLRGLVTSPIFVEGGALITTPGFHESGLYYWNQGELDVPQVSKVPTAEEVTEAKRLLIEEVLADFPLGGLSRDEIMKKSMNPDDPDGVPAVANVLSMLLLMFCRDMVDGPTPGHLLTKPTPGTGASLLTDVLSMIANGEETPAQALPANKEEMEKTLLTLIADGTNIIYFDNIDQSVDSGPFASALTAPKFRGRKLGQTQSVEAVVRAVWILCGNNMRMSQELIRRLVMVDLDAKVAKPGQRSGWRHDDIKGYIRDNRGDLVWACLTIIQNWVSKGMKGDNSAILNSYENWSRVMGGILREAGIRGFMGNRKELEEDVADEQADMLDVLLCILASQDSGTEFRAGEIMAALNDGSDETEFKPVLIPGWGYDRETLKYFNATQIGRKFRDVARRPHIVSLPDENGDLKDWEVHFAREYNKHDKVYKYTMTKKLAG